MLYKFLPSQRVGVLSNGLVRFSQPSALNDPYESRALVMPAAVLKELPSEVEAEFDRFLSQYPEHEIELHKQLISKTRADLHLRANQYMAPWRFGQEVMRLVNKEIGILSLTKRWDNLLMWSHYGESHQGFVIGLDETDDFFYENDGRGNPTTPFNVMYSEQKIEVDTENQNHFQMLLCQKAKCWEYEEETRVFRFLSNDTFSHNDPRGIPVHLFELPKLAIKEITVGANASSLMLNQILRLVHQHRIPAEIYQAYVESGSFELKRRPVSIGYRNPKDIYLESGCYKYQQLKGLHIEDLQPFESLPPGPYELGDEPIYWSVSQAKKYSELATRLSPLKINFNFELWQAP